MAAKISDQDLYAQEQFARIAKMLDEAYESRQQSLRHQAEVNKIADERLNLQQERQLAPWQIAFGGVTAGAALFAAAAAFTKYFL